MSAFAKAFGQIRARSSSQNLVFQDSSADRATQSQLALRSETRASERINVASGKSESKPSLDVEWSRINERKLRDSEIVRSVKNRAHVVLGKIPEKSTGTFPPKQWYTSGIIHAITAPKVSASQKEYITWFLTDLKGNTVKVMLFGEKTKSVWDKKQGDVVILMDPFILPQSQKIPSAPSVPSNSTTTLSINSASQVLYLGQYTNLKTCSHQGCLNAVNGMASSSNLCQLHSQQNYRDFASSRMDLNNGSIHNRFSRDALRYPSLVAKRSSGIKSQNLTLSRKDSKSAIANSNKRKKSQPQLFMLKPPKQVPLSSVPKLGRGLGNGSKYVDLDELSNEENHSCHVNTRDIPIEMKTSHEKAASILKGKEIPPPDPNSCSLRIQKFQYRNPSKSESSGSIRKY